ncbi:MAG: hypothetical protein AB1568_09710 [Thermodesulfobacteriota bacterium]
MDVRQFPSPPLPLLALARRLQPEDPDIARGRPARRAGHMLSPLASEILINPVFRSDRPVLVELSGRRNLPRATAHARRHSLMLIE